MHHVFPNSDSCMYWYLAYICEDIFDLRIYIAVMSPYLRDRGVTLILTLIGEAGFLNLIGESGFLILSETKEEDIQILDS